MRVVEKLPYEVEELSHLWIPMSDGTRLAGRLWRPVGAVDQPVPAVLEYIPYRKGDLSAVRDSIHHPYLAGHGYACLRVDIRGSGDSEGVLVDEYLEQEQRDAEDVLAWLREQPWCDGRLGMLGISWGAFASLQVAARQPPGLEAIVISSFTDDRYADDMHYMGGSLLSDSLAEAGTMFAYSTCPPDPAVVGEDWRPMWQERLDAAGPWVTEWLRHQRRDDYWRHASVCENYADIQVPVLASSGWADGYSNAVTRLLSNISVPCKGLVGPWSHKFPHLGEPGPAIGYLQEVVRWWDRWLKDVDNGVEDGPVLRAWMQDSVPPSTAYEERPGRWVSEWQWPSPHVVPARLPLGRYRIGRPEEQTEDVELAIQSPLSVGQFAGKWASYNAPPDLPYDQREEDGGSLIFDSEVLREPLEILGTPTVELCVKVNAPVAMIAARLSDVAPDGSATRVTYGLLNINRLDGEDAPQELVPGEEYRVTVELNTLAQSFPPGHRIRLSLSTSYWPLAWPPPRPVRLEVRSGPSCLTLPVRPTDREQHDTPEPFGPPEGTAPKPTTLVAPGEHRWHVTRDLVDYRSALEIVKDAGTIRFEDTGLEVGRRAYERYARVANQLDTVRGESAWTMRFTRGDWDVRTETRTVLRCTETDFLIHATLDGYEGDRRVFSRTWNETVPRDML